MLINFSCKQSLEATHFVNIEVVLGRIQEFNPYSIVVLISYDCLSIQICNHREESNEKKKIELYVSRLHALVTDVDYRFSHAQLSTLILYCINIFKISTGMFKEKQ